MHGSYQYDKSLGLQNFTLVKHGYSHKNIQSIHDLWNFGVFKKGDDVSFLFVLQTELAT